MPETNTKTILIVEDDPVLANTLRDAFTTEGYLVHLAQDGEEGLKQALELKPRVIFLDIMMPKMDGLEVLKNLNAQSPDPSRKIYMFTNISDMDKIAQALSGGAAGYFIKAQSSLTEILTKVKS